MVKKCLYPVVLVRRQWVSSTAPVVLKILLRVLRENDTTKPSMLYERK
nr:MAG TPA: hypothetical protein [Bacteriophage sp.]